MRTVGFVVLCCLALAGCKNRGDAAPDPNAAKAQQDLIARAPNLAHPPGRDLLFQEVAAREKVLHHEHGSLDV